MVRRPKALSLSMQSDLIEAEIGVDIEKIAFGSGDSRPSRLPRLASASGKWAMNTHSGTNRMRLGV